MEHFSHFFSDITDPRVDRTKDYPLETLIFITICAVVSGSDTWTEIETFGKLKHNWIAQYVPMPEGKSPCDDVYADFFKRIDTQEFASCFINWTQHLCGIIAEDLIAIDGKTMRGSFDRHSSKSAIHLVSAWSTANQLVLGQYKVDDKSNEITAIPALIKMLDIQGSMVSIDAMGCQSEIASLIVTSEADYILAVKSNQAHLLDEIQYSFRDLKPDSSNVCHDKGHGRIEKRTAQVIHNLKHIEEQHRWENLSSIIKITTHRQEVSTGKTHQEIRFYISSKSLNASKFNELIRSHWQIENSLHWVLDVTFGEDQNRTRTGMADANLSLIRKIAMNILKLDRHTKKSINLKRHSAALDDDYRQQVLKI